MVGEVKRWWSGCEGVCSWLGEVEESMFSHKPLACSADIIEKQRADVKVRHPLFVVSTPRAVIHHVFPVSLSLTSVTTSTVCCCYGHDVFLWWLDDVPVVPFNVPTYIVCITQQFLVPSSFFSLWRMP